LPRKAAVLRATGSAAALEDGLSRLERDGILAGVTGRDDTPELVCVPRVDGAEAVARSLSAAGLRVGIGEPHPINELTGSHETAGHALRLTTLDAPVVSWSEGVRRGALSLIDESRARAFATSYLAPLEGNPDLVETLGSFLRHHGSLLKVAEDLGVHRNTVRHRVERIEALLERSLADPQVRVDAWVALRARVPETLG
jgi:purine catabolism regulator